LFLRFVAVALVFLTGWGCQGCRERRALADTSLPAWYPALDSGIRPQDDFYRFVNSRALALPMPGNENFWSPVEETRLAADIQLRKLLLQIETDGRFPEGTDQRKALNFFKTAGDSAALNRLGTGALRPWLNEIAGVRTAEDFIRTHDRLTQLGINGLWLWQTAGSHTAVFVPTSPQSAESAGTGPVITAAFRKLGNSASVARSKATQIIDFKNELSRVARQGRGRTYRAALDAWQKRLRINWSVSIRESETDSVAIANLPYWDLINRWLSDKSNLTEARDLLAWLLLSQTAHVISPEWQRIITPDARPWWRHALHLTKQAFPDVFARLYLSPGTHRQHQRDVEDMVEHLGLALAEKIKEANYLNDSVKQNLLTKLSKIQLAPHPPQPFRSYTDVTLAPLPGAGGLAGLWLNWVGRGHVPLMPDSLLLRQPFEPTVVYTNDELVIPACLLQFPWIADAAGWSYGALGVMVSQALLTPVHRELSFVRAISASDAFLLVNALDVARRAAVRYEMERFSGQSPPFFWNHFYTAFAFSMRAAHRRDAAIGAERAAGVYDVLSSTDAFLNYWQVGERDKMFRQGRYRTPIW
jgi:hypothetical protein